MEPSLSLDPRILWLNTPQHIGRWHEIFYLLGSHWNVCQLRLEFLMQNAMQIIAFLEFDSAITEINIEIYGTSDKLNLPR